MSWVRKKSFFLLVFLLASPAFAEKRPLTQKQEDLVRSYATPLQEDMTYYRWQKSEYAKTLVQAGTVTPQIAKGFAFNPDMDHGTGLYLASHTWDSSMYGNGDSRLVEVRVKAGTLVLSEEAVKKLKSKGIDFSERKTNQSIVVTYEGLHERHKTAWYVAMNMNSNNVKISDYPSKKLSFQDVEKTILLVEEDARGAYAKQVKNHVKVPAVFSEKPWQSVYATALFESEHGYKKLAKKYLSSIRDPDSAREALQAFNNNRLLVPVLFEKDGDQFYKTIEKFGEPRSFKDRLETIESRLLRPSEVKEGQFIKKWFGEQPMSKEQLELFAKTMQHAKYDLMDADVKQVTALVENNAKRIFASDPEGYKAFSANSGFNLFTTKPSGACAVKALSSLGK